MATEREQKLAYLLAAHAAVEYLKQKKAQLPENAFSNELEFVMSSWGGNMDLPKMQRHLSEARELLELKAA